MATPIKWGNEFLVNTITNNHQEKSAIAALANGRFVATWQDESKTLGDNSPTAVHGQVFNADGSKFGAEFLVNTATNQRESAPAATGLPDGRFVVTWNSTLSPNYAETEVLGQIFNPDGTKSGDVFLVNPATVYSQDDPAVTALPGGNFVVAWTSQYIDASGKDANIHARRFDGHDSQTYSEFQANTLAQNAQYEPSIAAVDGGYVVAWTHYLAPGSSNPQVHAQMFDYFGKVGPELAVSTSGFGMNYAPAVTGLANGGFVVSWTGPGSAIGDDDVHAQRFDANGGTLGPEFTVNTASVNAQFDVTSALLPDGRFVLAWTDESNIGADTSGYSIRAQVFNANGSTSGGPFLVNTETENHQLEPSIAVLTDGRFVVSWTDDSHKGGDHSSYDVRAQIFDPRESAVSLQGTAQDDSYVGTKFNDTLKGGGGADYLNGGAGQDTMAGGIGDDTYVIDNLGDEVVENPNEGDDTVIVPFSYALPANVENLKLANGAGTINGIGNTLDNVITGNNSSNVLNGGAGDDTLKGGGGADLLIGGAGDDTAVYSQTLDQYLLSDEGNYITVAWVDGTDSVAGVEHLQFQDGTINVADDGNPLFDTYWYLSHNADVFHAGANALDHFNTSGWHEGRDPNPFFDTSGYLAVNKDVAASGANPLEHYHQTGWHEGRDPSADFDTTLYLIHNPDVAASGVDPLEHYLQHGRAEGRQTYEAIGSNIVNGFDAQYYLLHNPDVAASGADPLDHYLTMGWHEGRNPNAWFDNNGYLSHYADVAASGVNPLQHYEQFGWHEGRDPSAQFDTLGYLAANPDVAASGVNPLDHFLQNGIYEGRTAVNDGMWH